MTRLPKWPKSSDSPRTASGNRPSDREIADLMRRCAAELAGQDAADLYSNDLDFLLDKGTNGEVAAKLLNYANRLCPLP